MTDDFSLDNLKAPMIEHLSEWHGDPLARLASEYHERTEAFDRTVCTGPIRDGGILPAGPHERAIINRNALAVRRELLAEAIRMGFSEQQFQEAIVRRNHA